MRAPPTEPGSGNTDPLLGAVVAEKYRVVDLVARGGMGRIYRAEQLPLGREIALKILTRPLLGTDSDDLALEKRFLLEAATCARLTHPNTVSVYDYGCIHVNGDPTFYIVMELIRGRTLAQVLRAEGPFPAPRAARVAYEISRSLREAHHAGVVHRDLKPSNVMLVQTDEGESVKVLDFGVAKVLAQGTEALTTDGNFVGSPRYTAPEQIRQQQVDGRADLYALGIVLWEMLTGTAPFSSPEPMRTLLMQLNDPLPAFNPRFAVPPAMEALVRCLLAKQADERPADADTLLAALRPFRGGEAADSTLEVVLPDAVTQPTSSQAIVREGRGGRRLAWAALGLGAVAILMMSAVGAGAWWFTQGLAGASSPAVEPEGTANAAAAPSATPPILPAPTHDTIVALVSDPSGAEVWIAGKKAGTTPYAVHFEGSLSEPLSAELVRAGFKRKTVEITSGDQDGVVTVVLTRVETMKPPPPPPPPGDGLRMER